MLALELKGIGASRTDAQNEGGRFALCKQNKVVPHGTEQRVASFSIVERTVFSDCCLKKTFTCQIKSFRIGLFAI